MRLADAELLLQAERFAGAYYLGGYAVECALKAVIAGQVKQFDFPDRALAQKAWTHELDRLLKVAGLEVAFDRARKVDEALDVNWTVVTDWQETARYETSIDGRQAKELLVAIGDEAHGVLAWLRSQW